MTDNLRPCSMKYFHKTPALYFSKLCMELQVCSNMLAVQTEKESAGWPYYW